LVDQLILVYALDGLFLLLSFLDCGQLLRVVHFLLFFHFDDGNILQDLNTLGLLSILSNLLIELCVWVGNFDVGPEHVFVDGVAHFKDGFSQEARHGFSTNRGRYHGAALNTLHVDFFHFLIGRFNNMALRFVMGICLNLLLFQHFQSHGLLDFLLLQFHLFLNLLNYCRIGFASQLELGNVCF